MRGMDERSGLQFSYVDLEGRVRGSHPLRAIRLIVNEALSILTARFEALYSPFGRPSIPPEQLLRAMLLQAFYSIRSERQLMERLDFDLSFRWFVGLGIDDAVWDHSTFSKNRDRLLDDGRCFRRGQHGLGPMPSLDYGPRHACPNYGHIVAEPWVGALLRPGLPDAVEKVPSTAKALSASDTEWLGGTIAGLSRAARPV